MLRDSFSEYEPIVRREITLEGETIEQNLSKAHNNRSITQVLASFDCFRQRYMSRGSSEQKAMLWFQRHIHHRDYVKGHAIGGMVARSPGLSFSISTRATAYITSVSAPASNR